MHQKVDKSAYHPENDPRLVERHSWYNPENPANDPMFVSNVIEAIEDGDTDLEEFVHESFRKGNLSWLWHDGQRKINDIISLDLLEYLVFCSRQLGKSFFILTKAIEHCASMYKGRKPLVRIFCETQKQVMDIVNDNMMIIEELAPPGWIKKTKSEYRWKVGLGEIRVGMIASAHVHGSRGGNATLIITEEGAFIKSDEYKTAVQKVLSPQLLRSGGKLIHVTTSSEDDKHYIQEVVRKKCKLIGSFINLTIYDNPQLTDAQIIRAYNLVDDGTDEGWRLEYLCHVIRVGDFVAIPSYNEKSHTAELSHKEEYNYLVCGDFGGVRDLYCFHLLAYDFELEKVVVLEEKSFKTRTSTTEIVKSLRDWDKYTTTRVIDCPSQTQIDMAMLGYTVSLPIKEKFEDTVKFIRDQFFRCRLLINNVCKLLMETASSQKLNKQKIDWERNEVTGHADALMSIVYGLRSIDTITDKRKRVVSDDIWIPINKQRDSIENRLKKLAFNKER